jgi:predicted ATP-grasp superfamily ATP-dependent carboligase
VVRYLRYGLEVDFSKLRAERPPVLLLGGLSLLRPLGFAGIPAIVATPYPDEPALASRYCSGRCLLPPLANEQAVVDVLLGAGERLANRLGRRVPLYYGNDDHLHIIYAFRPELERYFLLLLNEPAVGGALIDKDSFERLARARGLPVPRTLAWDGAGEDALREARGPVVVKPRVKLAWDDSPILLRLVGGEGKARVFESGAAVMAHPLACQLHEQLTFQEYVPGNDRQLWSFHGFTDDEGSLLAAFVGRKMRTFPMLTGMSTFLELAHNEELAELGRDVVRRVPLKGVFKIDFKRDAASGRYYLLEINARYNLWHHMAAKNGINLPRIAYDYLVDGARPPAAEYRTAFRWLCLRLDFRAYRDLASRGELTFGGWLLSLLASRKVYDLFSWGDPLPLLLRSAERLRTWRQRGTGILKLRLREWLSTAL